MDTASNINERWRICTFASIASCFVLLLFLNQNASSPQPLGDIRMVTAASPSGANLKESAPDESVIKPVNGTKIPCNIFEGKWVYKPEENPLYDNSQCPFLSDQVSCQRNGRPDSDYQKWSWEAHECHIPRFNGIEMLERLRGKRVIIVGDSLNRNQWESLACLLYSALPPSRSYVDFSSGSYKLFKAKDYNITVEFYWSPFLVQLETEPVNGSKILRLDELDPSSLQWRGADTMVFNTGHWWKSPRWDMLKYKGKLVEGKTETVFEIAMRTWASWVDQNIDSSTTVFFRSTSPEHKMTNSCYNVTQPITDGSYIQSFPKPLTDIVEKTLKTMRTQVKYLNITKLTVYRIDAHPSIYSKKTWKKLLTEADNETVFYGDCSHWCLPGLPDTWNRLLYASLSQERLQAPSVTM